MGALGQAYKQVILSTKARGERHGHPNPNPTDMLTVLKSTDGKNSVRNAVQAELEEGFANHQAEDPAGRKKVFDNQEWLFNAVHGLGGDLKDIFDVVQQIKEKV